MTGKEYAFLVHPSSNRVYGQAAPALAVAELSALLPGAEASVRSMGGVPYVVFWALPDDLPVVADVSSLYALFEVVGGLLQPVTVAPHDCWGDELVTIPRYVGKTNEQFTKLLLNVTMAARRGAPKQARLRVLDPLCGRGTTLHQAVRAGYDAAGVEIDGRDVDAYATFFTTWLKDHRVRHETERSQFRREGKVAGRRFQVRFAADKADLRSGRGQEVVVVADDTRFVTEHFGPAAFDAIVADLPYGVQHGSRVGAGQRERRPAELLAEALTAWREVLRPAGAIGLSFNVKTLLAADAAGLLEAAGFDVVPLAGFEHRVDQAITRDLVVARSPTVTP